MAIESMYVFTGDEVVATDLPAKLNENFAKTENGMTNLENRVVPVEKGGTGATTVAEARKNLGLESTTDTKVTNTLNNNTTFYLTGTTSDITNTGTQIFNNNVFYSERDNAIVTPGLVIDQQGSGYIYATPDSIELSDRTNTGTLTATQYSGNAATATKATQDGNGNVITSTYVTNSTVGNAANKIPKYNAAGHLVLPDGSEFWIA